MRNGGLRFLIVCSSFPNQLTSPAQLRFGPPPPSRWLNNQWVIVGRKPSDNYIWRNPKSRVGIKKDWAIQAFQRQRWPLGEPILNPVIGASSFILVILSLSCFFFPHTSFSSTPLPPSLCLFAFFPSLLQGPIANTNRFARGASVPSPTAS